LIHLHPVIPSASDTEASAKTNSSERATYE
jgi:hypothetical protein